MMQFLTIKILDDRIGKEFPFPEYATSGSAALDLCACVESDTVIAPQTCTLIGSGIAIHLQDPNYAALILPRSGLGHKKGLVLGNGTGLIDSDYQGELKISCWNRSDQPIILTPGLRIAQLLITPIARPKLKVVDEFTTSDRGDGGFGSTGM